MRATAIVDRERTLRRSQRKCFSSAMVSAQPGIKAFAVWWEECGQTAMHYLVCRAGRQSR